MRNRLHALCPYFAMFPESFVRGHVEEYTREGDYVLDPFSGRGTTALQALLMGRRAVAVDINPVAACVSGAKAQAPDLQSVVQELQVLQDRHAGEEGDVDHEYRFKLPPFFPRAFHPETLTPLLFLRRALNWEHDVVHRFIAALVVGTLHGEMTRSQRYLSNQMPRSISPKPSYALRFWERRALWPAKKDVFTMLEKEARFRLSGDTPDLHGIVIRSDAREAGGRLPHLSGKIRAVITSPPYFNVTNFEEDQWLRLWFLGGEPHPTYRRISRDDRHSRKESYWLFLAEVWAGIRPLLANSSVLVCRLGGKDMDEPELTSGIIQTLESQFSGVSLISGPTISNLRHTQTGAFRPGAVGCRFEVDYVARVSP